MEIKMEVQVEMTTLQEQAKVDFKRMIEEGLTDHQARVLLTFLVGYCTIDEEFWEGMRAGMEYLEALRQNGWK